MRQTRRPILTAGSLISTMLLALLMLQSVRIATRLQTSWGDGIQSRRYLVWLDGALGFQTATGIKIAPPNLVIGSQWLGDGFDVLGFHYHQRNDVTATLDAKPLPGVYGTHSEFWIAPGWIMLLSLIIPSIWLRQHLRQSQLARTQNLCRSCEYDLRATPNRCPECGRVPNEAAAA